MLTGVLVTGGCGFVGTHLVKRLLAQGHDVTILDKIDPKTAFPSDPSNLGRIKFIKGDILDIDAARRATKNVRQVIHLAALIDSAESVTNPLPYLATNVLGTQNLLTACVENKIEKFIFASTAAVYGHCLNMPIREDENLQPLSPYGKSKISAEERIREYQRQSGLDATILRMFNIYGPGQGTGKRNGYSGVITKFMENVNNKQDLFIFGDGAQTRYFVNITDAVSAFMLALTKNVSGTFNIGTGVPTRIDQLAEQILQLPYHTSDKDNDHPSRIKNMDPRPGDIRDSCADISAATSSLDYTPKVSLSDGLRELYGSIYPTRTDIATIQDIQKALLNILGLGQKVVLS